MHNILDIIEISKSMERNKSIPKKIYENVHLSVSYDFSKFNGSTRIKVWHSWWYHPSTWLPYKVRALLETFTMIGGKPI